MNFGVSANLFNLRCQGVAIKPKTKPCGSEEEAYHKSAADPGNVYEYDGQRFQGGNRI